ncbi:Similar to Taf6: Transcription initiation factor TFIID subunit 6 (Drosophila melanogaster) [Cotesia congregata]|uniref:Transcription initiation factor TFIID subunit 6 n=1 Tax=Cotesia congregata TaxID=51543 RepID=A0A8J2HBV0_COTCN|nr:Similar to Taf6: Transcription initiation factor TFIID subunit 6 (Drosophila melanogaster) [Cotesia congregata]
MAEKEFFYGTSLTLESMKVIAESIGVGNLPDEAAKDLAEDVSCRLKHIIQDAANFMRHGKRKKLLPHDINRALKIKNLEPILGFNGKENVPFQSKEPEIIASDSQEAELNPKPKLTKIKEPSEIIKKPQKLRSVETVQVKELAVHELSVEQQLYYQKVTEACMSNNEKLRASALQSLSVDPGLYEMLARMCTFVAEGVKVNVVDHNLPFLIYLMRMVKALLDNPNLYLDKYLHEIIPAVMSCLVAKQLCVRPEIDNHWALRDFASRVLSQISRNFNNSANNIQMRIIGVLSQALTNNQTSLASLYSAIVGLCDLGLKAIKNSVIPNIKFISRRIEITLEEASASDSNAAGRIKNALLIFKFHFSPQKNVIPILKIVRSPPDFLEEYKQDYGYLGQILYSAIAKSRAQPFKTVINANQQQRSFSINKNQNQSFVQYVQNSQTVNSPQEEKSYNFDSKSETPSTFEHQEEI